MFQSETWFCGSVRLWTSSQRAFLCVKSLWITVPHLWPGITILLTMSSITPWCTEKQRNYIWYKCSLLWGVAYYSCICYFTPILSVTTFFITIMQKKLYLNCILNVKSFHLVIFIVLLKMISMEAWFSHLFGFIYFEQFSLFPQNCKYISQFWQFKFSHNYLVFFHGEGKKRKEKTELWENSDVN